MRENPFSAVVHGGLQDIHSANERRLTELIGEAGKKLHTGRSRNDQVATDVRLWLMDELAELEELQVALIRAALVKAEEHIDVIMPGKADALQR